MKQRKLLSLLLAAVMVLAMLVPAAATGTKAPAPGSIVILHTNDVHCSIDQSVEEDNTVSAIGYAGVAALKAEMEDLYGEDYVTLVDAGDAIQGGPIGTLSKGSYIVDIMNQTGYDIAIPGNHEFDYGMDNFLTLAKDKAKYTYVCSNFVDLTTNKPVFDAYKLVTYGDTKVAYVVLTHRRPLPSPPPPISRMPGASISTASPRATRARTSMRPYRRPWTPPRRRAPTTWWPWATWV